ncbi:MAG TPA: hypothetical protein VEY91_02950 [Candidatus Limnocylindria bacterium]|nr:hypothetical protein [Candidatus Limnocylindria bacterium]
MIRKTLLLLFTAALVCTVPVYAQPQQTLLSFTGYDYENPGDGGLYLAVGDGYKSVGFITSFGPLLDPFYDFSQNEYTYYLFDLTVATRDTDGSDMVVTFNDNGRVRYFEDPFARPYTPALYGTNPPNATAPSTFIDPGPPALGGDLDQFVLTYNFATGRGAWSGAMTLDEGSDLALYVPPAQRSGWILGAQNDNTSVPAGYDNQVEGNCLVPGPTSATQRTWGAIKSLYR